MNRTTDVNEPVWALCDFIEAAPTKRDAKKRFEACCVMCKTDEWAIRMMACAMNDWEKPK